MSRYVDLAPKPGLLEGRVLDYIAQVFLGKTYPRILLLVFVAAGGQRRFRGGSIKVRDRWFGFERKPDFPNFKRWYHRVKKSWVEPHDLASADEVQAAYDEWVALGRPNTR